MTKSFKLQMFELKKTLNVEQLDVSRVLESYLQVFDEYSEKEMYNSLRNDLAPYTYDINVKRFLESYKQELAENSLVYELKQIYKTLSRQNEGQLLREPMRVLLECISKGDEDTRMECILNELSMFTWLPEINKFISTLHMTPIERQNMKNSGKGEKIYTITEKAENKGSLVFIINKWFLLDENEIKQVVVDDYIKDNDKLREIRMLETALQCSVIENDVINFRITEDLTVGISTKDKSVYMNNEKLPQEATLEAIFNSPIIPFLSRGMYQILETVKNNINKFIEFDLGLRINNVLNLYYEAVAFNYKDNMYLYGIDKRTGSRFYKYENVSEMIRDVKKELDFDLTNFYNDKLSKEQKYFRKLEDEEKDIMSKLENTNESLTLLNENLELLNENVELSNFKQTLLITKGKLMNQLNTIKSEKIASKKSMI